MSKWFRILCVASCAALIAGFTVLSVGGCSSKDVKIESEQPSQEISDEEAEALGTLLKDMEGDDTPPPAQ